jgi:hypothetical protein
LLHQRGFGWEWVVWWHGCLVGIAGGYFPCVLL